LAAGTINSDTAIEMTVTATGAQTQLAAIEQLVTQATIDKPRQVAIADKVAAWFVAGVLLVAVSVGLVWWYIDASKAFWVLLSVLVVTCPCALSLAMPAALTAGINRARRMGLLVSGAQAMEMLSTTRAVVFDKTGTLTEGKMTIHSIIMLDKRLTREALLDILAALERHSRHPIARAFSERSERVKASQTQVFAGEGIEGTVNDVCFRFGRSSFAVGTDLSPPEGDGLWQLAARHSVEGFEPIAWINFADTLRDSAENAVSALKLLNIDVALLSGDREPPVAAMADRLGLTNYRAHARPKDKLHWLQRRQAKGERVLMVGDGINDVPVLSAADVSMAMGSATRLAQSKADSILLNGNLMVVPNAIRLARRVQRIVRQNLTWALMYNGIALPVAAAGLVPPWLAAIGMSLSSLLVVVNAMRV